MLRFSLVPLFVLFSSALHAADHGPFCQWHDDPCTTMGITWVEDKSSDGVEGEWALGPAGFGYGDGDDETTFPKMRNRFRSIYVRRTFTIPKDVPDEAELVLEIRYDDGFIAYVNGREVAREGVEGRGNTVQKVGNKEAEKWERFTLGPALPGRKGVIAIEGHNTNLGSSDFSLHPRLVARAKRESVPVVKEGALWSYLANEVPDEDWTREVPDPAKGPSMAGARYGFQYRLVGSTKWLPGKISSHNFGPTTHVVYGVDLTGLKPGSRYEFRIGRAGDVQGPFAFETAPAEFVDGMTFVTGGDMFHTLGKLDAMNKRAGAEDPLFALLGGDLAYANGMLGNRWLVWIDSWARNAVAPDGRLIPMVVVIGNHEVKGVGYKPTNAPPMTDAPYYYSLFRGQENGGQLAVDFGDYLSLVGLDSGHTRNVAKQTKWLDFTLGERSKIPRLFACYHRPAWGTGVKSDAVDIQREWSPLFDQHKVDAVFENDHHVYKRTHPILADGSIDEENGTIYMGDGAWGTNTRIIRKDWKAKRPWLAEAKAVNHLIKVTLKDDRIEYQALGTEGEVVDESERPLRRK